MQRLFQYVNFATPPESLIADLNWNMDDYHRKSPSRIPDSFLWSDDHNRDLDEWGKKNICSSMYFAFQIISKDLALHKDIDTVCKLNLILDTGGDNVVTEWYADDQTTLLQSSILRPMTWHIFRADVYHTVRNIETGRTRFAVTARIFP